jgi:pyridoxal phosphate enzyme, YggS family
MSVADNVQEVLANIKEAELEACRPLNSTTLVGVTKYVDSARARELVGTGVNNLAENRVDKFLEKHENLSDLNITWHFIGSLQSRKVRDVINLVDYFHALDSLKLAKEISKRADHKIKCFLQVNISGETSKHGFNPKQVEEVIKEISALTNIEVIGLMTMAPIDAKEAELLNIFSKARKLQEDIRNLGLENVSCTELSMGMSRDYKQAILEGATFVRIGSELFK